MIVKALKSFASKSRSCVEGETYDMPADEVKSLGGLVEAVKPEKPAKKTPAKKKTSK